MNPQEQIDPTPQQIHLRSPWPNLVAAIFGLIFFIATDIISVYCVYTDTTNHNRRPLANAILFGSLWSPFILIALYGLLVSLRESVTLNTQQIISQGILFRRSTAVKSISRVVFHNDMTLRLLLENDIERDTENAQIWLVNFSFDQRRQIVQFLKSHLPAERHGDLDYFDQNGNLLERRALRFPMLGLLCALIFFAIGAACLLSWLLNYGAIFLAGAIVSSLCAFVYAWRFFNFRETPLARKKRHEAIS